jgi:nitrogen fixation/metabolism regulation signal transduction histidine kinase
VVLLLLSVMLLAYLIFVARHVVTSLIIFAIIIFLMVDLIRFVEKTNDKITQFLESIRHSDFSSSFSDPGLGKSFERLNKSLNDVINDFKVTRAEKEEHYNYLQTVVQHVSIGIIAFRRDGKVDIFNNAVKRLLRISNLKNINELHGLKDDFPEILNAMRSGDKQLIKVIIDGQLLQLSVYATEFRMRGDHFIMVSLQNISAELEEKEIESWQNLIRVLTHEIMNSITPISSLASTIIDMLSDATADDTGNLHLEKEDVESVLSALKTIQGRSKGLSNFVEIFRNLTRIPKPNFRHFPVTELLDRCELLLRPKIQQSGIICSKQITPDNLMLTADPDLIDQVLINLMLNAIDAVKEIPEPRISIKAGTNPSGRVIIELSDNGNGIKPDQLEKIFMPFFTSKKEGSGIGLSLSRQIMHLHKGTIVVRSQPNEGTVFTMSF